MATTAAFSQSLKMAVTSWKAFSPGWSRRHPWVRGSSPPSNSRLTEQRQIVVATPGSDRLSLLNQLVDAALFGQQGPDVASKGGVGLLGVRRVEHLPKYSDQPFLKCADRKTPRSQ